MNIPRPGFNPGQQSFLLATALTFVFFGIGMLFLHFGWMDYGWALFVIMPIALGIAIGYLPMRQWALLGLGWGLVIFILLLWVGALEGMICVLMALPLIIPLLYLGIKIHFFMKEKGWWRDRNGMEAPVWPLLFLFLGAPLEKWVVGSDPVVEEVIMIRTFPFTPGQVYDAIKSVDTIDAPKPFLMRLDLPVPYKCVLEKEEVGALRTCYFTVGTITERITALEPGKVLRMDVIDYTLTGRHWLGFKEAVYHFASDGQSGCILTRTTTYTSSLRPRIYWRPLERWGIQQEHRYVFDNLALDLGHTGIIQGDQTQ